MWDLSLLGHVSEKRSTLRPPVPIAMFLPKCQSAGREQVFQILDFLGTGRACTNKVRQYL